MAESLLSALEPPQQPALFTGLGALGLGHPVSRFAAGTALGVALVWAMRPSIAFDNSGAPLQYSLFAAPGEQSTALPWYALAMVPGAIFALFV